ELIKAKNEVIKTKEELIETQRALINELKTKKEPQIVKLIEHKEPSIEEVICSIKKARISKHALRH
ncbi:hypothetical protein, partial [Campylobacter helveticus]